MPKQEMLKSRLLFSKTGGALVRFQSTEGEGILKEFSEIPKTKTLPLLGSFLTVMREFDQTNITPYFLRNFKEFGNIYVDNFFGQKWVVSAFCLYKNWFNLQMYMSTNSHCLSIAK